MTATAREIIKKEYGSSRNFMTPNVIRIGKINRSVAFELSSGESLDHSTIYGVSLAEIKTDGGTIRRTDISQMFDTQKEAEDYINQLKMEKSNKKKED